MPWKAWHGARPLSTSSLSSLALSHVSFLWLFDKPGPQSDPNRYLAHPWLSLNNLQKNSTLISLQFRPLKGWACLPVTAPSSSSWQIVRCSTHVSLLLIFSMDILFNKWVDKQRRNTCTLKYNFIIFTEWNYSQKALKQRVQNSGPSVLRCKHFSIPHFFLLTQHQPCYVLFIKEFHKYIQALELI